MEGEWCNPTEKGRQGCTSSEEADETDESSERESESASGWRRRSALRDAVLAETT